MEIILFSTILVFFRYVIKYYLANYISLLFSPRKITFYYFFAFYRKLRKNGCVLKSIQLNRYNWPQWYYAEIDAHEILSLTTAIMKKPNKSDFSCGQNQCKRWIGVSDHEIIPSQFPTWKEKCKKRELLSPLIASSILGLTQVNAYHII